MRNSISDRQSLEAKAQEIYGNNVNRVKGRMMKKRYFAIRTSVLATATAIILAVSLTGCNDPIVADMEAEHIRLGNIAQQELRQDFSTHPPSPQTETLFPAP